MFTELKLSYLEREMLLQYNCALFFGNLCILIFKIIYIYDKSEKNLSVIFKYTYKKLKSKFKKNERGLMPNDITSKIGFVPFA